MSRSKRIDQHTGSFWNDVHDRKMNNMKITLLGTLFVATLHCLDVEKEFSPVRLHSLSWSTHKAGYTLFTFHECFLRNTPRNTKRSLYTLDCSCVFLRIWTNSILQLSTPSGQVAFEISSVTFAHFLLNFLHNFLKLSS